MYFATGDYICDVNTGLSVVSTAFAVPALTPDTNKKCMSSRETVSAMENTDFYRALPPKDHWKLIGWDIHLSIEAKYLYYLASFKFRKFSTHDVHTSLLQIHTCMFSFFEHLMMNMSCRHLLILLKFP